MFNPDLAREFQNQLRPYYLEKMRDLPWRQPEQNQDFDAYKILVSEIMLQQTQVNRVIPYYKSFINAFPNVRALADADLQSVVLQWHGLGYNRRARFLREAARQIVALHDGKVPDNCNDLVRLPGVGSNTAGAVLAYGFSKPALFVETNIRTVMIHHFFNGSLDPVSDKQIVDVLREVVDQANPRAFYWAMMDYGTQLKSSGVKNNPRSVHYKKQSVFKGSLRELRGKVLRCLATSPQSLQDLQKQLNDQRLSLALSSLKQEGMVASKRGKFFIAN